MSDPGAPAGGKTPIGGELVLPALAIAFTVYFFVSVADLGWEAKANAVLIGVALLALIGVFLIRVGLRLASGEASLRVDSLIEPRRVQPQRVLVVGLTALFVATIPWLGVTLGLFLLVAALMMVLRAGSWRLIAATAAGVAIGAYLLFIALLNSRLPRGPIEKLLAALF